MPVKSLILSLTLALSLTANANVTSQGLQSLLEVIAKKSNVEKLLERRELFAAGSEAIETVSNDFNLVLKAFGIRGGNTQTKLAQALKSIKAVNDEDQKIITKIQKVLQQSVDKLSDAELLKAHDELLYLSSRYGKKGDVMLVCLDCTAGSELTSKGIKYSLQELKNSKTKSILKEIRSLGPTGVSRFIKKGMSAAKYGSYEKVSGSAISADQEIAFALFLKMKTQGSTLQKRYVESVERVLGKAKDGSVDFFNSNRPHSLHMFFQENHETPFFKNYTKFLNDIADAKEAEGISPKEAYEKVLRAKAMRKTTAGELKEDPVLLKRVNKVLGRCPMFR